MHVNLNLDDEDFDLYLAREGGKIKVEVDGEIYEADVTHENGALQVQIGDQTFHIAIGHDTVDVNGETVPYHVTNYRAGGAPGAHGAGGAGAATLKPPMPGKIVDIRIQEGDEVEKGQVLLILEAMKMQNEIAAPVAGTVKTLHVKKGQNVEAKDLLLELG